MSSRNTIRDHFRETQLFNVRAIIAVIMSLLMIFSLIGRLIYLQIVDHDLYTTLSENNRFHIAPLPPTRGLIYDRNGVLLAQNLPSYALEILPERVKDMQKTLEGLGKLIKISDSDLERFYTELKHNRPFKAITLRSRLTDTEVARIAVNRHLYPGIDIAARLIRHYPQGGLAAHALGYVGRINENEVAHIDESDYDGTDFIGKTGVEKYYEATLHGHVGIQQVETNANGRSLRQIEQVPSEAGLNLHLSLDAGMQAAAEQAFGDNQGALVAINPKTGDILTLVSMPTFDPNLFVTGIDHDTYNVLQNSPAKPLYNRALRGRYPPGSTVKPFIALAGLENDVVKPETKTFCPGYYTLAGSSHRYRDWKKTGHGHVNMHDAIVQSCDVYFYDLAHTLGIDRLSHFLMQFGFNYKTGVDIAGETSGLMPTRLWKQRALHQPWYPGETLIAGIGQGYVLITPMQMAESVATLASYGKRIVPHIVKAISNASNGKMEDIQPQIKDPIPIVKRENWEMIIKDMVDVTATWHGTAHRVGMDAKYKIAAKTGTAQVFSVKQNETYKAKEVAKNLRDHALFIAFAPAENPQIAVAAIVEHGGHGGSVAGPIVRKIMDYYLIKEGKLAATKADAAADDTGKEPKG